MNIELIIYCTNKFIHKYQISLDMNHLAHVLRYFDIQYIHGYCPPFTDYEKEIHYMLSKSFEINGFTESQSSDFAYRVLDDYSRMIYFS